VHEKSKGTNTFERPAPSAARMSDREGLLPLGPSRSGNPITEGQRAMRSRREVHTTQDSNCPSCSVSETGLPTHRFNEKPMSIRDIIRRNGRRVETINGFESVRSAALKMRAKDVTALIVTELTVIRGLLSGRDIVQAISIHGAAAIFMSVRDVMSKDVRTVALSDSSDRAMRLMAHNRIHHLLVIDDDAVAGLVSIDDLASHKLAALTFGTKVFARPALAAS
jgi:CBS domain-containing protein